MRCGGKGSDLKLTVEVLSDGNPRIGFGHLRRSMTLARDLKRRGHVVSLRSLSPEGQDLIDPSLTQNFSESAAVAVFDMPFNIDALNDNVDTHITKYKQKGIKTVALDYFGESCPDLVISVHEHIAPKKCGERISGFEFVIVREDLREDTKEALREKLGEELRAIQDVEVGDSVLVAIGGSDQLRQGPGIAEALSLKGIKVILVEGPFSEFSNHSGNYEVLRKPKNFTELMRSCRWGVTNGGGTLFEMLYLGKPVHVVPQTNFEDTIGRLANKNPGVLGVGIEFLVPYSAHQILCAQGHGKKLVDGNGTERIMERLERL